MYSSKNKPSFISISLFSLPGKALLRHMEIEEALKDPATEEEIPKSTFIVYFQGEQLKMRVKKICEGLVLSRSILYYFL